MSRKQFEIDIDLERHVLGELMFAGRLDAVADLRLEKSFGTSRHRKIYRAMANLFASGKGFDSILLARELERMGSLQEIGGDSYLVDLTLNAVSDAMLPEHARLLVQEGLKRELCSGHAALARECMDPKSDVFELLERAHLQALELSGVLEGRAYRRAGDLLPALTDKLDAIARGERTYLGVSTGFKKLDAYTGGLESKQLYVIAGRPSQGKTALALSMAARMCREIPIGFQSLEMAQEEIMLRLLSIESGIPYYRLKSARIEESDSRDYARALEAISAWDLFIDDSAGVSLMDISAKARRLKSEHGIRGLFIDYLGLMRAPHAETRDQAIGALTRGLKELAKQLDIFVVLLAQLNRQVESRADKKPMLADLRESGNIEQDADVVIFVHRPEYYGAEQLQDGRSADGVANLLLAKQRNGATGEIEVEFQKNRMAFRDRMEPAITGEHKWIPAHEEVDQ